MTFAYKTSNMYRLTKEEQKKLLRNAITSKYEKANSNIKDEINKKGKEIVKNEEVLHDLSLKKVIVFSHSEIIKRTSKTTQQ